LSNAAFCAIRAGSPPTFDSLRPKTGTTIVRQTRALWRIGCLLGLLVAAPLVQSAPKPVKRNVVLVDYSFEPDHLIFRHGVHYQLHLENHGKETHEFTAPVFFATATIDNPGVLDNNRSEITLQPGDKKDVFLTPHNPGKYDLRCADHDWYGMVGGITVK
jgi:uncharacterized cupredoxin-like copper-binding protein